MIVRDTRPADHSAVRAVVEAAFGQPVEADLVEALRASGDAVFDLVAEADGSVVGHILLSKLQAPVRCLGLAPVSVAPDRQGRGIGAALIREALARAKEASWAAVFLLGDPAYYSRFGFAVEAAAKFESDYPKAYVMALALQPGALEARDGPLTYAPPFSALG